MMGGGKSKAYSTSRGKRRDSLGMVYDEREIVSIQRDSNGLYYGTDEYGRNHELTTAQANRLLDAGVYEETRPRINNLGQLRRQRSYFIEDNIGGQTGEYMYGGVRMSNGEEVNYFYSRSRGELEMDVHEFNGGDYTIRELG